MTKNNLATENIEITEKTSGLSVISVFSVAKDLDYE
jgi:hypothetical protein